MLYLLASNESYIEIILYRILKLLSTKEVWSLWPMAKCFSKVKMGFFQTQLTLEIVFDRLFVLERLNVTTEHIEVPYLKETFDKLSKKKELDIRQCHCGRLFDNNVTDIIADYRKRIGDTIHSERFVAPKHNNQNCAKCPRVPIFVCNECSDTTEHMHHRPCFNRSMVVRTAPNRKAQANEPQNSSREKKSKKTYDMNQWVTQRPKTNKKQKLL